MSERVRGGYYKYMKTNTTKKIDFQFGIVIGNWGLVLKVEKQGITLKWGRL